MPQDVGDLRVGDKSPPHSLDAEQGLLGAILFENDVFHAVCGKLKPDHFFDPMHARIFASIGKIIAEKRVADAVTLRERFTHDDALAEIGGAKYILTLVANAARLSTHQREYADLIFELWLRREAIRIARAVEEAAIRPQDGQDAAAIIARAELSFRRIETGRTSAVTARSAGDLVIDRLRKPQPPGLRTGIPRLDRLIGGLFTGDLFIVAGRPAMGKTALATNVAFNVARSIIVDEHGEERAPVVAFFSQEMDAELLASRMLSRLSFDTSDMAFEYSELRSDRRPNPDAVAYFLRGLPETLLIDETPAQSVASITAAARAMRREQGALDLIIIDYLQLMQDASARREGRVQEVSAITAGLKTLARQMRVPVVALSQLSRQVENRADKTPQLADLRDSGTIEQDADVVLFIYREHYYLSRNPPIPGEDEDRSAFAARLRHWEQRCEDTATQARAIAAKQRMRATGSVDLICHLASDLITGPVNA